jgi:GNAT superfamily N-acetyltransferase
MNTQFHDKPDLTIEPMTQKEVDIAIAWAQKEGWNPGIHDAECFYHADPNGFYAAKLDGEIAGTISLVKYPGDFVFEGLYIVKPQFRGRGIGSQIQRYALNLCKDSNLGLDGVVAMQKKYTQYGFKYAYNNSRYAGTAQDKPSRQCRPIQRKDFSEIAAFDLECFGYDRSKFLDCWLFQKDAASLSIHSEKTGIISGYGVIRKCMQGHKIGPLFADNQGDAERLFNSLTSTVPGETVFLDVPQPNRTAVELAEKKRLQPVFSTVRMYTKTSPIIPLNKIYGVTTFELG